MKITFRKTFGTHEKVSKIERILKRKNIGLNFYEKLYSRSLFAGSIFAKNFQKPND